MFIILTASKFKNDGACKELLICSPEESETLIVVFLPLREIIISFTVSSTGIRNEFETFV